jgi:hypothetical protein
MLKYPVYLLTGLLILGGVAAYEWRGMAFGRGSEVRNVPRSVRDNPGSYRPHYMFIGSRYRRGK